MRIKSIYIELYAEYYKLNYSAVICMFLLTDDSDTRELRRNKILLDSRII